MQDIKKSLTYSFERNKELKKIRPFRHAIQGEGHTKKRRYFQRYLLIVLMCLLLMFQNFLKAEEYPLECRLSIWTDETDCSEETLLVYQIGADYDPVEEKICWASFLEEEMIQRMEEEKEIPSLINKLERILKKGEPFAILSPEKNGPSELSVPSGVYLLIQDSPKRYQIQSSLAAVPYMNEEENGWIGECEIHLKTAPVPETSEPDNPNTGDELKIGTYMTMFLISTFGIGLILQTWNHENVNNKK